MFRVEVGEPKTLSAAEGLRKLPHFGEQRRVGKGRPNRRVQLNIKRLMSLTGWRSRHHRTTFSCKLSGLVICATPHAMLDVEVHEVLLGTTDLLDLDLSTVHVCPPHMHRRLHYIIKVRRSRDGPTGDTRWGEKTKVRHVVKGV